MIFWQINSYGMIAPQGCLTELNPVWTVEEGTDTWSKRERGFPSSFLMPSITVDLAAMGKNIMHKTKLRYWSMPTKSNRQNQVSLHKTHLNQEQNLM